MLHAVLVLAVELVWCFLPVTAACRAVVPFCSMDCFVTAVDVEEKCTHITHPIMSLD